MAKLRLELVTNAQGQVNLPKLPTGMYSVFVTAGPRWSGDLLLSLAPPKTNPQRRAGYFACEALQETKEEHSISMKLTYMPTREEILAREDQLAVTKVSAIRGTVQDISGARIPNAKIEAVDMKATARMRTVQIYSNAQGQFAADLPDGDYVVTFNAQGFVQRVLHLVISSTENTEDLQIKLEIGTDTQSVTTPRSPSTSQSR